MSLVPTYVLADDGLMYKNPAYRSHDWFLCFDDDDPPEIVMAGGEDRDQALERAIKVLDSLKVTCTIDPVTYRKCTRMFNGGLRKAFRFFLKIEKPIPINEHLAWKGRMTREKFEEELPQCCYYTFGVE